MNPTNWHDAPTSASAQIAAYTRSSGVSREIREVHRNLGAIARGQIPSHRLHEPESAGRLADLPRNRLRNTHIRRRQIRVERDQEIARSNRARAHRNMRRDIANIRRLTVESGTPYAFQAPTVLAQRGGFVKIRRHAEPPPDLFTRAMRDAHAVIYGGVLERHKRDDVRRTHARMRAFMQSQIDTLRRCASPANLRLRAPLLPALQTSPRCDCDPLSDSQPSSRTPRTLSIAATISRTVTAFRPSEKFGTHSIIAVRS